MFAPTQEQQNILDAVASGGSVVVDACAGTGKTSTLRAIAEQTEAPKKLYYLVFNKSTQVEANRTFPSNTIPTTTHALANGQVRRSKYRYVLNKLGGGYVPHAETARELGIEPLRVGDAKISHITLAVAASKMIEKFCSSPGTEITPDMFTPLVNYDPKVNNEIRAAVTGYARAGWANLLSDTGRALRFEHSHYLKLWASGMISDDGALPRIPNTADGDLLLYDEAQDANSLMAQVVSAQRHMQLVYVGDEAQAINRFMGSINAMRLFDADHRLALTRSWRFGPRVADAANVFLAALGSPNRVVGNPDRDTHITDAAVADAVLCRTNAAVIAEVITEQQRGQRVAVLGGVREAHAFVVAAEQLRQGRPNSHRDLSMFPTWGSLVEYVDSLDNPGTLGTFVKIVNQYGTDTLKRALDNCVDDPHEADVQVSTAHKSKGAEWDRVRIATDFEIDLAPTSPDAVDEPTLERRDGQMLAYVAVTRGRKSVNVGSIYDSHAAKRPAVSATSEHIEHEVAVARIRESNGKASTRELAEEFLTRLPTNLRTQVQALVRSSEVPEHELLRRALTNYMDMHSWG